MAAPRTAHGRGGREGEEACARPDVREAQPGPDRECVEDPLRVQVLATLGRVEGGSGGGGGGGGGGVNFGPSGGPAPRTPPEGKGLAFAFWVGAALGAGGAHEGKD